MKPTNAQAFDGEWWVGTHPTLATPVTSGQVLAPSVLWEYSSERFHRHMESHVATQPYPQIPASVWWGVRDFLQRSPNVRLEPSTLAARLGVQEVAARQYAAELKRIGIIDEDFKPTELAARWRMDNRYREAVEEIASEAYPDALAALAPPGEAERSMVKDWFMGQGLGEGAANNKAATYLLVTSPEPGTTPKAGSRDSVSKSGSEKAVRRSTSGRAAARPNSKTGRGSERGTQNDSEMPPLNVNVQIHISADATKDQIETIFAAMRTYLRDA